MSPRLGQGVLEEYQNVKSLLRCLRLGGKRVTEILFSKRGFQ